jgi:hypothetical protein
MAHESIQALVGTALVDSRFRSRLLSKSPDVLSDLHLTPQESEIIMSIRASTLQSFAGELDRWIAHQSARR